MKNNPVLFIFLAFLMTLQVSAQDRSFGTLPLVRKPGGALTKGSGVVDSTKYKDALKIYNTLVAARGDYRFPVPAFVMRKETSQVAGMNYDALEIKLEEKAYDVCKGFGPDSDAAIAFLLGHELTHYYEKHAWRRGFAADYKDLPIGIKLDSLQDDAANETEADYLGGFLAYSAGYGLFDKGPEVIKGLYNAYNLPDKIGGYPSLQDREELTRRSAQKLNRLVDVFDMANLLTAIGSYQEAYQYYRYILMEYQSREIYNNLGVTAVLDALQYFKEGELKYRYPIELDLESSAGKGSGMVDTRNQLLRQALLHFEAAISMDPNYAPAYLNKACVYAIMGDAKRAAFYAEEEARPAAVKGHYDKTVLDVDVLTGILDAEAGNTAKATQTFKTAAAMNSNLAAINLGILNNTPPETEPVSFAGLPKTEKIDDQSLTGIADNVRINQKLSITLNKDLFFHQNPDQGPGSRLFVSQNGQTGVNTLFQITSSGYKGNTARNIGLGATGNDIITAYQKPQRTIETPLGQIMVYSKMIFILGKGGKLERWVNYLKL